MAGLGYTKSSLSVSRASTHNWDSGFCSLHRSSCLDLFFKSGQKLHGTLQTASLSLPSFLDLNPLCSPLFKKDLFYYASKTYASKKVSKEHRSVFILLLWIPFMSLSLHRNAFFHRCVPSEKFLCLPRQNESLPLSSTSSTLLTGHL